MNETISAIIITIFAIAVLIAMSFVLFWMIYKNHNKTKTHKIENTFFYNNEMTSEEEIIILLKNIAQNQKKIKTNTTVIAVILLIPIIISILIFAFYTFIAGAIFG